MRFVERMRQKVQQGHLPRAEAALHQHEAHLRAGRPREHHFDADACRHHQRGYHRRGGADGHQQHLRCRYFGDQRRKTDQHKTAQVDHAGMQQGGDRCRCFHHLNQPAVKRQLRAFHQGCHGNQQRGGLRGERQRGPHGSMGDDLVDMQRAKGRRQQRGSAQHAQVGCAGSDELLVRRHHSRWPVTEEIKQSMHRHAGGHPRQCQQQHMIRRKNDADGCQRGQQPANIASLFALAVQIGL